MTSQNAERSYAHDIDGNKDLQNALIDHVKTTQQNLHYVMKEYLFENGLNQIQLRKAMAIGSLFYTGLENRIIHGTDPSNLQLPVPEISGSIVDDMIEKVKYNQNEFNESLIDLMDRDKDALDLIELLTAYGFSPKRKSILRNILGFVYFSLESQYAKDNAQKYLEIIFNSTYIRQESAQ